jgi:hypothetical protein
MQQIPFYIRRLRLYTDKPFPHYGADLRRAITAAFPDRAVLHNHRGDQFDYRSPRVRYVVLNQQPQLISFDEGLHVLEEIYRDGHTLSLSVGTQRYRVTGTELEDQIEHLGTADTLLEYRSLTPWLGLNERNYVVFQNMKTSEDCMELLSRILNGNYLSLCKAGSITIEERLMTRVFSFRRVPLSHRGTSLLGLKVAFASNMLLPEGVGLGKLVSKGFGLMARQ